MARRDSLCGAGSHLPETSTEEGWLVAGLQRRCPQKKWLPPGLAPERGTMCVPLCVMWVMLLWVAMSCCYNMDVCFEAGRTENHKLHPNFRINLYFFSMYVEKTLINNFLAFHMGLWSVLLLFLAVIELLLRHLCLFVLILAEQKPIKDITILKHSEKLF